MVYIVEFGEVHMHGGCYTLSKKGLFGKKHNLLYHDIWQDIQHPTHSKI